MYTVTAARLLICSMLAITFPVCRTMCQVQQWLYYMIEVSSSAVSHKENAHHALSVFVDGKPILQKSVHRHLGLHLDEYLSWSDHTLVVVNKVSSKIGLLYCMQKQLAPPVICDIYQMCILPTIEYGSLAWSGMGKSSSQLLDRVHRCAARLMS